MSIKYQDFKYKVYTIGLDFEACLDTRYLILKRYLILIYGICTILKT